MNPGATFSPDFPCDSCRGLGELSHSRGHQGFLCESCKGTGARLCGFCQQVAATDVVDGEYACFECLPLAASTVCWQCMGEDAVPVAMHGGVALCTRCLDEALRHDTEVPDAPATIPAAMWPEAANDSDLEAGLGASLAVAEAAHEAGMPAHEGFRSMRRSAARRVCR